MKNRASAGVFFLLLLACSLPSHAQVDTTNRFSFEFRGARLAEVLDEVAEETGINLVYDPELVKGFNVYQRIQNRPVPDLLSDILRETPLDFITLSSGTIVIVQTVREAVSRGSYFGKVVDSQTGEPLAGATVMLADASGGTSTTRTGNFALSRLVTGSYTIIFSYVGYEPVYKTIDIKPDQNVRGKIALDPKPIDFIPIVVTGHLPRMPNGGTSQQSIQPNSQWEVTGRMQDAIRSLTLFSGVQYGLPMTDLHVQGGQPGEHRILLDGVPVYNPYSFGQMFSAFSPYAISKVELHKAGYGVPEGSQIAGLIDLKHDINSVQRNRALMNLDPLSLNIRGDLNFKAGSDSSLKIMAAARSNYWDIYQEPTLQRTLQEWDNLDPLITDFLLDSETDPSVYEPREHYSDVRFYDVHAATSYDINEYNTLSSSFYMGENYVNTNLLRQAPPNQQLPEYLYARDEYLWNNIMGQLTWDYLVSPRLDISTRVSLSSNRFHHRYVIGTNYNYPVTSGQSLSADYAYSNFQEADARNQVPNQRSANSIDHLIARSDATYSFSPNFNMEMGLQIDYVESQVDLTDLFYLPTFSKQTSTLFSTYVNGKFNLGEYWNLTAGNRLTYHNSTDRFYPQPRASIQLDRPDSNIGYWSVRLAGGLYRQFINQFEITNPGPTSLVPSFSVWSHAGTSETPKAWHLTGSFLLEPSEQTTLKFEGFYKWQPTTYIVSYENLLGGIDINRSEFEAFGEATDMKSYGAGFRLNQSAAGGRLKLMLGYDYNYTEIDMESQFGRALPAPWNEPHRFQLRTLWRVYNNFSAVVKWQSIWGRAWGFRRAYYDFLAQNQQSAGKYTFTSPEDDRLSPFHQLDVSFIYEPSVDFMDLKLRLDLINLLNRRNTIDWGLRSTGSESDNEYEIIERTMPGFNPSISLEIGI